MLKIATATAGLNELRFDQAIPSFFWRFPFPGFCLLEGQVMQLQIRLMPHFFPASMSDESLHSIIEAGRIEQGPLQAQIAVLLFPILMIQRGKSSPRLLPWP
ncbi:hypothetical protein [Leisingera methylohalidivorans]|uniref:Uncharacterized protein n=1 Tax=Leisingera methylohalidivorans DSM 14336 TaxID=999552 RepID=V9W1T6_9RHOB|nr:hypothetical protein [Leisingera methylohalidivorans]AHD03132.1 hypothetical protein METH_13730 [Leisingera methylohalidivorans DSM 14336]